MTKINVTDIVANNATCSTINDMDIDMASDVAANMAADVAFDVAAHVDADVDNDVAASQFGPICIWPN